jgi:hypothetical protein
MLATAAMLAFATSALGVPAEPQSAVPTPPCTAPRGPNQEVKATGGVIRGRITSLDTGKPLRRAQVRLSAEYDVTGTPRTASTSTDGRYEFATLLPGATRCVSSAVAISR